MSTAPEGHSSSPPRRGNRPWRALAVALAALALVAGYIAWTRWRDHQRDTVDDTQQQVEALSQRLDTIRSEQRSHSRRLQQADSLNRVLRDELNAIGQRAALLEDSVSRLADPDRHGAQALRLDEAELLLMLGEQRLQIAGDLNGARRAYALAGGVLDGIDDPAYLSLRQTLQQERAALDALGTDPRVLAMVRLDAFAQSAIAPVRSERLARDPAAPWWRRAFGALLQVQPSDRAVAVQPADRSAALAGLQLEISLARAAAERRDAAGYRAALQRADAWLQRLVPESAELGRQRDALKALSELPLSLSVPALGSTLQQLRQLRAR